jgi:tungstate transport system permease protein
MTGGVLGYIVDFAEIVRFTYVIEILNLTAVIAFISTTVSLLLGVPLGIYLYFTRSRFKSLIIAAVNTGMGAPPVVVGLVVFLFLSRKGPFGGFELLYTPAAIVIAEVLLGFPVVAGLVYSSLSSVPPEKFMQLLGFGATYWQALKAILSEARLGMLTAVIAAFGAVVSEVGAALMVGGNIEGSTRVLTTAIVLETRLGNFGTAIFLGAVLFLLAFVVNYVFTRLQRREENIEWLSHIWR